MKQAINNNSARPDSLSIPNWLRIKAINLVSQIVMFIHVKFEGKNYQNEKVQLQNQFSKLHV